MEIADDADSLVRIFYALRLSTIKHIKNEIMKLLWCWRCKMEIPMLEDDEFERVMRLRGTGAGDDLLEREFGPVLREYERITGFHETNINSFYHQKASLYGPPCRNCGKPLRTPQAKICGACMTPATDDESP